MSIDKPSKPRWAGPDIPAAPIGAYDQPSPKAFPEWRARGPHLVYCSPARTVAVDQWEDGRSNVTVEVYAAAGRSVTNLSIDNALNMADAIIARFRPAPAPRLSAWARFTDLFHR